MLSTLGSGAHLPALVLSLQIGRVAAERSLESLQQQVEHVTAELGSAQVCEGAGPAARHAVINAARQTFCNRLN